jgi:hypothetical protein
MATLKTFENDLINFIKNHKYTKEQEAELETHSTEDGTTITIHTVDGDYERIQITIEYTA